MSKALDFIAPASKQVILRENLEIKLSPIRVKQIAPLARACEPMMLSIMLLGDSPQPAEMLSLAAQHSEALIEAVSICSGLPVAQIELMLPDELALLALGCVEVNADFFAQALPQIKAAAPSVAPNLAQKLLGGLVGAQPQTAPMAITPQASTS